MVRAAMSGGMEVGGVTNAWTHNPELGIQTKLPILKVTALQTTPWRPAKLTSLRFTVSPISLPWRSPVLIARNLTLGFALAILFAFCPARLSAQELNLNQLITELRDRAKAQQRSPEQLLEAYTQVLRSLLPQIGSEKMEEQQGPQQTFQEICWHASRPGAEEERSAVCKAVVSFLKADTPSAAREWLVKQLGYVGREESVEALSVLLADKEAAIAERACRALQRNPAAVAGEALRLALEAAQTPQWRVALINALGFRNEAANAAALRKYAADDDDDIRCAALQALASLGDRESASLMAAAMEKGSKRAQAEATDAYLKLADVLSGANDRQAALGIYRRLLNSTGHVRCAAVLGIGRAGGLNELPLLFEALADKEAKVQGAARGALAFLPAKEVNTAITEKLKAASADFKVTLLEALADSKDPGILPVLIEAAKDAEKKVRLTAIRAMGGLAAEGAIPVLIETITHAADEEVEAAQDTLALIPGGGVVRAVEKALDGAAPKGRVQLVRALASRPSEKVMALLRKSATDADLSVRVESLNVMTRFAQAKDVPFLLARLLARKDEKEQAACHEAITAVCRRVPDKNVVIDEINAKYRNASKEVQLALLPVFGLVGGEEALAAVRSAWASKDAEIKNAALQALVEWPDALVAEDLLAIAREGGNLRHRRLALRGYLSVVGMPDAFPPATALRMYQTAMEVAPGVEEKKLVLAGIGGLKDVKALEAAEGFLGDGPLRVDAATALLRIADAVRWSAAAEASQALGRLAAVSTDKNLQQKAKALLDEIAKFEDYITAWVYSGPWMEKGKKSKDLFDAVFPPETEEAPGLDWRQALLSDTPEKSWAVDFNRLDRGDNRAGYIRTWVWAPAATRAQLEIGSDDGVKAWLNGKVVVSFNGDRAIGPAQEKAEVDLEKGWSSLFLKVVNGGADWEGAARFRTEDGTHLKGLVVLGQPEFAKALLQELGGQNSDPRIAQVALDTAVAGSVPTEEAKAMLRGAARLAKDEKLRERASQRLNEYEKYEDYIVDWQVCGPYMEEGKDGTALFDIVFPPERPDAKDLQWKPAHAEGPYEVMLEKIYGGDNRAAYLRSWIVSPKEMKAQLEIGSDDGVKAWLNGNLVHANNVARPTSPGQDKAPVTLRQGVNALLVKITQGGGHWSACARFRAEDGSHIEGLQLLGEQPTQGK